MMSPCVRNFDKGISFLLSVVSIVDLLDAALHLCCEVISLEICML